MKRKIFLTVYKVPIKIEDGEVIELTQELTKEMVLTKEPKEINSFELIPLAKRVANYNARQKIFVLETGKDYIKKKIITKN